MGASSRLPVAAFDCGGASGRQDNIESAIRELRATLAPSNESHGVASGSVDALMRGQYDYPDGINFGGSHQEWSNSTFRAILAEHVASARHVALIDWHTGIGAAMQAVPLAFYGPTTRSAQALTAWLGLDVTQFAGHFPGGETPAFTGILSAAIPSLLSQAITYAVVVEFGTKPNADVLEALMIDRWLKFGPGPDTALARRLKAGMLECFSPNDAKWRASVIQLARRFVSGMVTGLANEAN